MKLKPEEIEVPPEQVRFLREEVLGPLPTTQVADLLGVCRGTLYLWMKEGIGIKATALRRYKALEEAIEQNGARAIMEGRIIPVEGMAWKSQWRCAVLVPRGKKFVRCRHRRMVGERFCFKHLEEIKQKGAMYMTIDGDIPGFRERRGFRGKEHGYPQTPQRCTALTYGGIRCIYVGKLVNGLCSKHVRILREGNVHVLKEGVVETRYAEKS